MNIITVPKIHLIFGILARDQEQLNVPPRQVCRKFQFWEVVIMEEKLDKYQVILIFPNGKIKGHAECTLDDVIEIFDKYIYEVVAFDVKKHKED